MNSTASIRSSHMLLLVAAVLWSTSGVLVKSPPLAMLPDGDRGPIIACYRALFAAAFLLPFVRRRNIRWRPALIPLCVCFAAMNVLFVTALTKTTAAAAIFLQYTSAIWASMFAYFLLRERIDRGNLVALACALCGIAWIVASDWQGENFAGNSIALASGCMYGGVVVCLRVLRAESSAWLIALVHVVSGACLLPWVLGRHIELGYAQWGIVAALGILQMGLPYLLFARAVRYVETQEAALITLIEPILNPLWVWLLWGEAASTATWIGGMIILFGLSVRYFIAAQRGPRPSKTLGVPP